MQAMVCFPVIFIRQFLLTDTAMETYSDVWVVPILKWIPTSVRFFDLHIKETNNRSQPIHTKRMKFNFFFTTQLPRLFLIVMQMYGAYVKI